MTEHSNSLCFQAREISPKWTARPYPASRNWVLECFEKEKRVSQHNGRCAITSLSAVLFAKKLEDFPMSLAECLTSHRL